MADDRITLSGINWRETFTFTHLFRTFRVAIHPSKLILGVLLLLSLYLGGRFLDLIWPVDSRAVPGEVAAYAMAQEGHGTTFDAQRRALRRDIERQYARLLRDYEIVESQDNADAAAAEARRHGELIDAIKAALVKERTQIEERYLEARKKAEEIENASDRQTALNNAEQARKDELARAHANRYAEIQTAKSIKNQGIFEQFLLYEIAQVNGIVNSVLAWNWLGNNSVISHIWNFLTVGPGWLISHHPLFFFLLLILFLVVWSIFGGAIARIAAVHVAREEKISIRQALSFSVNKLLSYAFAPIIPLLIVVGIGVVVGVASLIGNIPFVGEIVVGLLFFLALIAGFVMTLVTLGLIGGFNLMYPTIAVEGSDSFDAISRSFSYIYARPWKMAFYTLVAVIYGALTYLFVRFFIWLMLMLTHTFVSRGFFRTAENGQDLFHTMWPQPEMWNLPYDVNFLALGTGGDIAASLILFWVYLVISMLGAYAISFYFSANTIIYYLMRKDVDATELDDVYVEQMEEEFTETPPAPEKPATAAETPTGESSSGTVAPPSATPPAESTESTPAESSAAEPTAASETPPPAEAGEDKPDEDKPDEDKPDNENRPQ